MARSFGNNKANFLSRATSIISNGDPRPITIALWLKAAARGQMQMLFSNNYPIDGPTLAATVVDAGGGSDKQGVYTNGGYVYSSNFVLSTTTWTHLGWTYQAAGNAIAFFLNGAANGTGTRIYGGTVTNGAAIGTLTGALAGFAVNGSVAEFAVWNAILTAGEFAALAGRVSPMRIRPANLACYLPIWGAGATTERDVAGGGTWAVNGTLTQSDHAPVQRPFSRRLWVPYAVAAAASGNPLLGRRSLLGVGA